MNVKSLLPITNKLLININLIYVGTLFMSQTLITYIRGFLTKRTSLIRAIRETKGNFLGETTHNAQIRWNEHNSPRGFSEISKHPIQNSTHSIQLKTLSTETTE